MPCSALIVVAALVTVLVAGGSLVAIKWRQARLVRVSREAASALGLAWRRGPHGFEISGVYDDTPVLIHHVEETADDGERVKTVPVLDLPSMPEARLANLREQYPETEHHEHGVRVIIREELGEINDYRALLDAGVGANGSRHNP